MTLRDVVKAGHAAIFAGEVGEDISYRPGGDAGSAFTIRAVVDRSGFERGEFQDTSQRVWMVHVLRDDPGTSPPTGVVTPTKSDRIELSRYFDSSETVTVRVNDFEQADDGLWDLVVVL